MPRHGVVPDDLPKNLEALPVLPGLVQADTGLQQGQRPLVFVPVFDRINRLEVGACLGMIRQHGEVVLTEFHVGQEPYLAQRIPFDDRAPQLEPLVALSGVHPQIPGLEQPARGAVLDDRPARWPRLGLLRRLAKRE